jgi:hypothetical protein
MAEYNTKYLTRGNKTDENIVAANEQFNNIAKAIDDLEDSVSNAGKVDDVQVNGTSIVTDKTANVPVMTSTTYGVAKVGSDTTVTTSASTASATYTHVYYVQKNSSGQLVVGVPWTNTAHSHSAGVGLELSSGSGGISGTTTYKVALTSETKLNSTPLNYYQTVNDTENLYAVQLDSNGKLAVYVPWSDAMYMAGNISKTATKLYIIGATSKPASISGAATTYSNENVYIGEDNELYSNGKKVGHAEDITTAQNKADSAYNLAAEKGQSLVFATVAEMTTSLKNASNTAYNVGYNIYIEDTGVPDYWISAILTNNTGTYGYYEISELETGKVDLSGYQTKSDNSLNTTAKTVVEAINEVKSTADTAKSTSSTNSTSITNIINGTTTVGKATKATQDASGNVITSTYATKTESDAKVKKVTFSDYTLSDDEYTYTVNIGENYEVIAVYKASGSSYVKIDTVGLEKSGSNAIITADIKLSGYLVCAKV